MNRRPKIYIIVAVVVICLIAVAVAAGLRAKTGTLVTTFHLPDEQGLVFKLDGTDLKLSDIQSPYPVTPGPHHVAITKPYYSDFSADFTAIKGKTTTLNITLSRISEPSTANLQPTIAANISVPNVSITNAEYFYQKTWTLVTITIPNGPPGFLLAKYDDTTQRWQTVLGPGTSFELSSTSKLPKDVVDYMQSNNFISGGSVDDSQ